MYKGKVGFGAEPAGEVRAKKGPKDLRRTSGAYSHQQARIQSAQTKNQLSKYKMKVPGQLLDYVTLLENEISETKKEAQREEKMFFDLVLNVSNFLGLEEVSKDAILKYLEGINVMDGEHLEKAPTANNLDWFDLMQQNRFKQFLYGAGGAEKIPSKQLYSYDEPVEQKRKYKKSSNFTIEAKRKKKEEIKKAAYLKHQVVEQPASNLPGSAMMVEQPVQEEQLEAKNEQPATVLVFDTTQIAKGEMSPTEVNAASLQKLITEDLTIKSQQQLLLQSSKRDE